MCWSRDYLYIWAIKEIVNIWIYLYNVLWGSLQEFFLRTSWWTRKHSIRSSCSPVLASEPTFTRKKIRWIESMHGVNWIIYINVASTYFVCDYIQWRFVMFHVVFLNEPFANTAPNKIKKLIWPLIIVAVKRSGYI